MKQVAVRLSIATYTPVGHWLDVPLIEIDEWAEIVAEELQRQRTAQR